ncbi:MAG: hypothetical protein LBE33_01030 [Zoogloeaceae bacterium]|jgi:hypothetical protein|nr:hypothetical protein [Zoogloeaceae bacterium]
MTDLWDDPNLTLSKIVLNWLLKKDKQILTCGFNRSLIEAMEHEVDKEELTHLLKGNRIIPDAYRIDREHRTVFLFEVEDTNTISPDKLKKLSEIWYRLDCLGWEMRVFLIDRYMHYWSILPLSKVWHSLESENASKRNPKDEGVGSDVDWEDVYQNLKRSHILGHDGWT